MPCCCATNVKAAFVLGIVLAVLSGLSCFNKVARAIANGIIGAVIHCILIFGAHTRNSTAMLIWMVLAILSCIGYAIFATLGIAAIAGAGAVGAAVAEDAAGAASVAGAAGQEAVSVVAVVFVIFMIGK